MSDNDPLHIVASAGLIYGVNEKQPILTLCGAEIFRTRSDFPIDTSRPVCAGCKEKSDGSVDLHPPLDPAYFGNARTYSLGATRTFRWGYKAGA